MAKGGAYERSVCKRLSLWWTAHDAGGPREDVFWRTAGSGARAKVRSKRNVKTANSCGDVGCIDPCGAAFIKLLCTEVKKGYPKVSPIHFLDKRGKQQFEEWIDKAEIDAANAGSMSWAIIHRRDRHEELIWMPFSTASNLILLDFPTPHAEVVFKRRNGIAECIIGVRLADFFKTVKPVDFHTVLAQWENKNV